MILKRHVLIRRLRRALPLVFLAALLLYGIWPWLPFRAARPRTIVFYGFSILGEVMSQRIFPAFQREWASRTGGEPVEFISAFGGSGTVVNQIVLGAPADVAMLSLELDALKLADAGVVRRWSWREEPHAGVVNSTPFVILVRPGNPKGIHDFADVARPGVRVVHPDPLTSGGANWAIVAEYGAGLRGPGGSPQAGLALLTGIWRNVVALASSARAARTQFDNGFGDALITYEQELLFDQAHGRLRGEIVYPRSTIRSEHTVVVVTRNTSPDESELVGAFVDFLWSEQAQQLFVAEGFRSVEPELDQGNPRLGRIPDLFTIEDLGGWIRAEREIIDERWKGRVLKEIRR